MRRASLFTFAVFVLVFSVALASYVVAYSDFEPAPEISNVTQPLFMSNPYPGDLDAVPASSAVVFLEVSAGFCCQLLDDNIRVMISACTAPRGTGFKIGDTGVELDSDFSGGGGDFLPGIKVDISDVGCSLPINGTPIEVTVLAEARTPLGGISIATYNWTFFATGSSSSPPPPAANEPPPFEIQSVNPTPLVPGQPRLINGRGFTSTTQVLFNTEVVPSTFNSLPRTISFMVPEGLQCGDHSVQLRNPGGEREYSNMMTFPITQDCQPPTRSIILPTPIFDDPLNIESLFQSSGGPGDNVIVNGTGFIEDSRVYFNRQIMTTTYIGPESLRFTVEQGTPCGDYNVYVRNKTSSGDENSNTVTYSVVTGCRQQGGNNPPQPPNEDPPPNDPPPNDPPPNNNPPPPPANANEVEEFDTDGDCEISNNEFFSAVDRWLSESITDSLFFAILDAWISEDNVCTAAVTSTALVSIAQQGHRGIMFSAPSKEMELMGMLIYDLQGNEIFKDQTNRNRLSWNLRTSAGEQIANGVYLYRAIVKTEFGDVISTKIGKFIVQR